MNPRGRSLGPAGAEAAAALRSRAVLGWSVWLTFPGPAWPERVAGGRGPPCEAPGAAQADKPGYLQVFADALSVRNAD